MFIESLFKLILFHLKRYASAYSLLAAGMILVLAGNHLRDNITEPSAGAVYIAAILIFGFLFSRGFKNTLDDVSPTRVGYLWDYLGGRRMLSFWIIPLAVELVILGLWFLEMVKGTNIPFLDAGSIESLIGFSVWVPTIWVGYSFLVAATAAKRSEHRLYNRFHVWVGTGVIVLGVLGFNSAAGTWSSVNLYTLAVAAIILGVFANSRNDLSFLDEATDTLAGLNMVSVTQKAFTEEYARSKSFKSKRGLLGWKLIVERTRIGDDGHEEVRKEVLNMPIRLIRIERDKNGDFYKITFKSVRADTMSTEVASNAIAILAEGKTGQPYVEKHRSEPAFLVSHSYPSIEKFLAQEREELFR